MRLEPIHHDPFSNTREIYVIRHGATALNKESGSPDRIRAWKDIPLSPEGLIEAQKLAKKLANSGIDEIHASTLKRAMKTAEDIAQTTKAQLIPDPDLKPWNLGHFTGQESNKVHSQLKEYVCNPQRTVPGGESFNTFKFRVLSSLGQILSTSQAQLPAFVTHHRVERLLAAWTKAGQRPDLEIDYDEMMKHGESTASARKMKVKLMNGMLGNGNLIAVDHNPFTA